MGKLDDKLARNNLGVRVLKVLHLLVEQRPTDGQSKTYSTCNTKNLKNSVFVISKIRTTWHKQWGSLHQKLHKLLS